MNRPFNHREPRVPLAAGSPTAGVVAPVSAPATHSEAVLLEAYGPLEMARVIESLRDELAWISEFAAIRSQDDSKTFARVNRGALRTIAQRANAVAAKVRA